MIYVLTGDDKTFKDFKYNNIKSKLTNFESKTFYIKTQKELELLENEIELFLITSSFFYDKKIAKLDCNKDIKIDNLIVRFSNIVNDNAIMVIFIDKIDSKIKKKISNISLIKFINYDNSSNRNEAFTFTKDLLINSNLQFKSSKEITLIANAIISKCEKKDIKKIYDKSIIYLEIKKLTTLYKENHIIEYKEVESLYKETFDGNFFYLIDQIFYKENRKDIINMFDELIDTFSIEEVKTFLNILIYTLKEYLKYTNQIKTNKYYLFKNSKVKIKEINTFIIYTHQLALNTKITNKFNKEDLYIMFLKFIDFK